MNSTLYTQAVGVRGKGRIRVRLVVLGGKEG